MNTDWIGPSIQSLDAARANVWRVQEARHAERFSERMSSTAYQRATADLRAAGLNPILAAGGGMESSSPVGVPAQIQTSDIGGSISSAIGLKRLKEELKLLQAQTYATTTQGLHSDAQTGVAHSVQKANEALAHRYNAETQQTYLNSALTTYSLAKAANLAEVEKSDLGRFGAYADRVLQMLGLGSQALKH
ncbi:minor capsid protein [Microviridae sp.]|nr:minor capsid protein [Microviridae sp.]UOF82979.1 minor capsid protein [Microviridae sp.]